MAEARALQEEADAKAQALAKVIPDGAISGIDGLVASGAQIREVS